MRDPARAWAERDGPGGLARQAERPSFRLTALGLAWLMAWLMGACELGADRGDGSPGSKRFADELRSLEAELAARGVPYAEATAQAGFRPSGGVAATRAGHPGVWLFGGDSGRIGFMPLDPPGPLSEVIDTGLPISSCTPTEQALLCTGPVAPGAWLIREGAVTALRSRGGYRDGSVEGMEASLLDTVDSSWVQISLQPRGAGGEGAELSRRSLLAGTYRAIRVGGAQLAVVSGVAPRLTLRPLSDASTARTLSEDAPVRDLVFDEPRQMLWTVGPAPAAPRRAGGPLRGLYSVLHGYPLEPDAAPRRVDLRAYGVVDATGIALWQGALVVVGTGSHNALLYEPESGSARLVQTGHAPAQPIATPTTVVIPNRLSESVTLIEGTGTAPVVSERSLGRALGRSDPARLGELLFYEKALWSDTADNQFTCNSCHWDLCSDHRMQPGMLESRWEMTRPLRGIGMITPVFTPMQSPTLADAVDGLFEALDARHWEGRPINTPITLTLREGPLQLSPHDARAALLSFLMTLGAQVGPLRQRDGTFTPQAERGAVLFQRDCAGCHEPTADLRAREPVAADRLLRHLRDRPLSFGAPLFARSGVTPYYTSAGNRISPLLDLARGGPFFSNGSAPTLEDLLHSARPGSAAVHDQAPTGPPSYDADEVNALRAFLLSI